MPIPNVYTATEDPTSQIGNNGDIYFHTGLIGLSAINVYKKVNGLWGLTGTISTNTRWLLSTDIARVDPTGRDTPGVIGNSDFPFPNVQNAINAFEAGNFINPIIDTGAMVNTEEISTSLSSLSFVGRSGTSRSFDDITCSENITLYFIDTSAGDLIFDHGGTAFLNNSYVAGNVTGAGQIELDASNDSRIAGTVSSPGRAIFINGFLPNGYIQEIDSAGSAVSARGSVIRTLTSASSISLNDSRVITNNAAITPTYVDVLLNPALMDFSTLPTSLPTRVGAAWIDPTGGFNIIKVKL